jgi:PKD repeat protein
MIRPIITAAFLLFQFHLSFSQHTKPSLPLSESVAIPGENIKSAVQQVESNGLVTIDPTAPVWTRTLKHRSTVHESDDKQKMKQLKTEKLKEKRSLRVTGNNGQRNDKAATPIVNANFNGNAFDLWTPSDNSLAISNGGIIVSAINSTLNYYSSTGTLIATTSFNTLINNPTLNGKFFDPKVIYDSGSDRFIFVVLHDAMPSTSKVVVGFSQTNDPTAGWFIYTLNGNPLNDGSWFDYPSVGISTNELFISGNLFDQFDVFNQTVVYQVTKTPGYSGSTINVLTWSNISGSPFTLVPISYGQQGTYGPGIFLVSSGSGSGSSYSLYDISDDIGASPTISQFNAPVVSYSAPADAEQKGSTELLSTGGSRILSGFFLDNTIHLVHNTDVLSGWSGIRYARMNTLTRATMASDFGNAGSQDFAYPAIASFGTSTTDKSVMISYQTSGSNQFPGVAVVNCDNNMIWSAPTVVKAGDGFVDILSTAGNERWGDYTGMSRKQNAAAPTVWLGASYANSSNTYTARIAEITAGIVPAVAFTGSPLIGQVPLIVQFQDNSTAAVSRKWTFPGGTPSTSTSATPSITYLVPGEYDVSLEATNTFGTAQSTKTKYVNAKLSTVGIEEGDVTKNTGVYPNPATTHFSVLFDVAENGMIEVELYTVAGKMITTLFSGMAKSGKNEFMFNTSSLESGIYLIQIKRGETILSNEKLVVNN